MTKCGKLSVSIERSWSFPDRISNDAVAILRITGAYPAFMRPRKQTFPSSSDENNMDDILEQLTEITTILCAKLPTFEDNNLFSGTLSKQ